MPLQSLDDLFVHFLRDIYYAEKQIVKALPKMARKAESKDLREAFEHHLEETQGHVANLEQVFELLELKPRGSTCEAIDGILDEADHADGQSIQAPADPAIPNPLPHVAVCPGSTA